MTKTILAVLFAGLVLGACAPTPKSTDLLPGRVEWAANPVIYEVNIRQFSNEGTITAVTNQLPRLKSLGVDILWVMPVQPISLKNRKGTLGSYYAVADYTAVNPEFGSMADFKSFVDKAHELGMKVILDWVANHTGWDNKWITAHPDWYTHDSTGVIVPPVADWTDVADLNYDSKPMRAVMVDAMKFWLTDAGIDGFRCDVAGMVPLDFWNDARAELSKVKPLFMLAEASEPDLMVHAFDAAYGWEFHHLMNAVARGEKTADAMVKYFEKNDTVYAADDILMNFVTNHDENSWNGSEYERMGDGVNCMVALSYIVNGMPLIYTGQEAGLKHRLRFFDKDTINWSDTTLYAYYRKLSEQKHRLPALATGMRAAGMKASVVDGKNILKIVRTADKSQLNAVFNFMQASVDLDASVLGVGNGTVDLLSGRPIVVKENTITLSPFEVIVWE